MIGIYKFTNKINGKCYIGQSIQLEKRKREHKYNSFHKNSNEYNSQFHKAIRKYGIENFDYEVLEFLEEKEYTTKKLNELEKKYINYFNSYKNGYNATPGGDAIGENSRMVGEKNGRAILSEEDVIYIRECYNNHIPFNQVYKNYENKISKRGFQNVWWFNTWKNIKPEYNNEENKFFHSHQAKALSSEQASKNNRIFNKQEILNIRKRYDSGESVTKIWKENYSNISKSTIYRIANRLSYKDIQ